MRGTDFVSIIALFGFVLLSGCDGDTSGLGLDNDGPVTVVKPGIIQQRVGGEVDVTLPTEAAVGEPVSITVRSFGNGCFQEAETTASVDGLSAVVVPFDSIRVDVACTEQLRVFEHVATLTFSRAGVASVAIVGRRWPDDRVIVAHRTLDIR